jgi:hypothetical protein
LGVILNMLTRLNVVKLIMHPLHASHSWGPILSPILVLVNVQSVLVHTNDKLILIIIHQLFHQLIIIIQYHLQQLLSSCILVIINLSWTKTRASQSLDQTTHESHASLPDIPQVQIGKQDINPYMTFPHSCSKCQHNSN